MYDTAHTCSCYLAGAVDEEEEGEDQGEESTKKRKPWGDSAYFCPVALSEQGVLWPGSEEHALRYAHTCTVHVRTRTYIYIYVY